MDRYSGVYVYTDEPFDAVLMVLARHLKGAPGVGSVDSAELSTDLVANDDYDEGKARGGAGDFVHFPYLIEIEPRDGVDDDAYVTAVADLLVGLADAGYWYVTAADFELQLPGEGRCLPSS